MNGSRTVHLGPLVETDRFLEGLIFSFTWSTENNGSTPLQSGCFLRERSCINCFFFLGLTVFAHFYLFIFWRVLEIAGHFTLFLSISLFFPRENVEEAQSLQQSWTTVWLRGERHTQQQQQHRSRVTNTASDLSF